MSLSPQSAHHPPACLSCCLSQQHIPIRTELSWSYVTISSPLRTDWVWLRPHRPAHSPSSPSQPFLLYFNSVCGDSTLHSQCCPPAPARPASHRQPDFAGRASPSLRGPGLGGTLELKSQRTFLALDCGLLYISTVTSSTARDQWERGRSDWELSRTSQSHHSISSNGTSNREQINQGIWGQQSVTQEYRFSFTKLSDS